MIEKRRVKSKRAIRIDWLGSRSQETRKARRLEMPVLQGQEPTLLWRQGLILKVFARRLSIHKDRLISRLKYSSVDLALRKTQTLPLSPQRLSGRPMTTSISSLGLLNLMLETVDFQILEPLTEAVMCVRTCVESISSMDNL